ncbi:MAG TPA: hypothetical protein VGK67_15015 [Myxococcales bacterium]|jgi:hypothetical protein
MRTRLLPLLAFAVAFLGCSLPPREVVRPDELVTKTPGATALVVVYSRSGNTAAMARALAGVLGADYQRLSAEQKVPDSFLTAPSWTERVPVTPEKLDLAPYQLVLVGGPIWQWHPNAVSVSFLQNCDFTGKGVVLFYTFQGGKMSQETEDAWKKMVTDRGGKVLEIVGVDRKSLPEGATVAGEAERIARERKGAWVSGAAAK